MVGRRHGGLVRLMSGRKLKIGVWLLASASVGAVVVGAAGSETRPAVPATGIAVTATEPAYSRTRRVPEDLLDGQRRQVIILPREPGEAGEDFESPEEIAQRSGGVVAKIPAEQHRLPEGYVIGSRVGRIEREGDWFIARLEHREGMPDAPPLRVLPNRELAMVEAILGEAPEVRQYLLTGRITEFQGTNYLLLEHVAQVVPGAEEVEAAAAAATSTPRADESQSDEPSPAEIVKQLMKNEPQRALVLPAPATQPQAEMEAAEGDEAEADRAWPEGTFLVDRQGRVVPGGDSWWTLAWEDRGELARRKPIRLLPNRLLETALSISGAGTRSVVFIVSGEVLEYKGTNYLLLRKVLVRRDLGNLR